MSEDIGWEMLAWWISKDDFWIRKAREMDDLIFRLLDGAE